MIQEFKDKIILVTGGTGSIGSELVKKLLQFQPKSVRILSRGENKQYYLMDSLGYPKNLKLLIGDIREKDRVDLAMKDVDIVFHAAALKHVPLCEYNPYEAVKTNIMGTQNIIDMALKNNVKKVIGISTDKAVNPVNIMGVSKLMMEKLFINANISSSRDKTRFSCVRFGNVAWATGSVLPLWKKQADQNKTIKVTNNNMTRFLISKDQAIDLVLRAEQLALGGEIFILKMPSIKLSGLAKLFIEKYYSEQNIKIEITGMRPGEKMNEELFDSFNECRGILKNNDMYIVIPDFEIYKMYNINPKKYSQQGFDAIKTMKGFSSKDSIDNEKIKKII